MAYHAIDHLLIHETAANNFEEKITDILRNNGDMIIQTSTFVSFDNSALTTYFQCIHLPVCQ